MKDTLQKLTNTRSFLLAIASMPNFIRNSIDLIISSCIINLLSLVLPLVIFQLYDRILPYKSVSSLSWLMVGAGIAVLLDSILRQIRAEHFFMYTPSMDLYVYSGINDANVTRYGIPLTIMINKVSSWYKW